MSRFKDMHIKILTFLSNGIPPKQIGAALNKSPRTIEKYIDDMKCIMEVNTAVHLVAKAIREKIIQ